jgi:hypothetical protein
MKDIRDRMMAQRQAQGGQPGTGTQGAAGGGARPEGQGGQTTFQRQGGGTQGASGGGQARAQIPKVWLLDKDGKLSMAFLRTGVSDTTYSEIVRSDLKEGDVVILGTQSATGTASTSNQPGMNMMFMGGPPPGGRR